jgi:HNH endonuclease
LEITLPNTYPKDWPKIVDRIKDRAGNRCERCGVGPGEPYTRRSGRVVSKKEFERLGKEATRARLQRLKDHEGSLRRAKERFLSPLITEAETSGDYDRGYFAEGGYYPFDGEPLSSQMIADSNNNIADRFEVHHIDEDKSNNDDSNLEFLCKRCHDFKHNSQS